MTSHIFRFCGFVRPGTASNCRREAATSDTASFTVEGASNITDALDQVVVGECAQLRCAEQLRQFVALLLRRLSLAAAQFLPDAAGIFRAPCADQEGRKVMGQWASPLRCEVHAFLLEIWNLGMRAG
jgi:hypothetical protein